MAVGLGMLLRPFADGANAGFFAPAIEANEELIVSSIVLPGRRASPRRAVRR
jgi:hypothetical protein